MNIYDFKVDDAKGHTIDLETYRGKVLLIVNTATGCGFTPQYKGLECLYEKYCSDGFEILDFPCNQFGHQAPGTEKEISDFCTFKYHTTFKLFKKVKVNGKDAIPLYKWLKKQKGGIFGSRIKWNFTKFLIDRNGNVTDRFSPVTPPEKIEKKIIGLLSEK